MTMAAEGGTPAETTQQQDGPASTDASSSAASAAVAPTEASPKDAVMAHTPPSRKEMGDGMTSPPPSSTRSVKRSNSGSAGPGISVDQASKELNGWIKNHKLGAVDAANLETVLKDHDELKNKISKLKGLLGRSAKAQREAKVDLESTQRRLDQALREIERLNNKIDKLANRPTHMELLADFETKFDRAVLSVGQPGGQDTAPPPPDVVAGGGGGGGMMADAEQHHHHQDSTVVDNLLMQELGESKQRIEKLESLNAALSQRSAQLEDDCKERKRERDDMANRVARLELEKRMAVMEADSAMKSVQEKAASLEEMQMEIDLVTKASVTANARAAQGEEMIKTVKTDKQHVQELEAKVQALQEWALASAEAKALAQDRVHFLENQINNQKRTQAAAGGGMLAGEGGTNNDDGRRERVLFADSGSLVVGAGDTAQRPVRLEEDVARSVGASERVFLRWQFDSAPENMNIHFSLLKGIWEENNRAARGTNEDYLIKDRSVLGGAAGETDNAFTVKNACTLQWANIKSWVRPRTVKYTVFAIAAED